MKLITKTSLLFFFSCLSLFAFSIAASFNSFIHSRVVVGIFAMIDVYTNFICVYLSFEHFHQFYLSICGFCDVKCYKCWMRCIGHSLDEIQLESNTKMIELDSLQTQTATV